MKLKLKSFIKNHYIWILIVGVYIALKIENNALKNAVLDSKTEQQKEKLAAISERDKKSDSLIAEFKTLKKSIDTLLKTNEQLKNQRIQRDKYYDKKINDVDNATNDELQRYLSDYKYSKEPSSGN